MIKSKHTLWIATFLLGSVMLAGTAQAQTQTGSTAKPSARAATKNAAKAAPAAEKNAVTNDDDEENKAPDLQGSDVTEYSCDHGQKITLYRNPGDPDFIAMRWQKHSMRMRRVTTSTGAERFENRRHGMLWIGIPSKGMLLDSKKGQQLANECRNAEQTQSHEKK